MDQSTINLLEKRRGLDGTSGPECAPSGETSLFDTRGLSSRLKMKTAKQKLWLKQATDMVRKIRKKAKVNHIMHWWVNEQLVRHYEEARLDVRWKERFGVWEGCLQEEAMSDKMRDMHESRIDFVETLVGSGKVGGRFSAVVHDAEPLK